MKFTQQKPIILASGSPRRREYLARYGFDFHIKTADIPEIPQPGEAPLAFATRLAREKGQAVKAKIQDQGEHIILSADTIVVLGQEILGKPEGPEAVLPMLQKLSGHTHQVITAYCIFEGGRLHQKHAQSQVTFFKVDETLLKAYSQTQDPLDKAGSYSLQGPGSFLVQSIQGSFNNVVGLPIELLIQDLYNLGLITPLEEA